MSGDYAGQVRAYLADCRRAAREMEAAGSSLDPKHHPTEAGCLKLVYHRNPDEAAEIRAAFRAATGTETA